MTITIEELRKVDIAFEYVSDSAILKLARFVADRQRAVEPTKEMRLAANRAFGCDEFSYNPGKVDIAVKGYRAMSAVAPLVVEG